jgi:hypothetical protein
MQKCRNGRWALPKMGAFEKRIEKKIGFINTMGRKGKKTSESSVHLPAATRAGYSSCMHRCVQPNRLKFELVIPGLFSPRETGWKKELRMLVTVYVGDRWHMRTIEPRFSILRRWILLER